MTAQNNPATYAKAIQAEISSTVSPVPVYSSFNRNYATQEKFITWTLRNVHQQVFTGSTQSVKSIDRPIFQLSIFSKKFEDGANIANTILQNLHGFSGQFGGINGFFVSKIDISWLYHSYDNEINMSAIYLDCTMDIPA